jgi:excisionase family DNA binding protein
MNKTDQGTGPPPVAYSVPAAAAAIGVGTTTVRALIRSGELRAIRVRNRLLVPLSEIDAFVQRRLEDS